MSKELADRFNTYVAEWVSSVARPDAVIAPTTEWPKLLKEVERQSTAIADANANAERENHEAVALRAKLAGIRESVAREALDYLVEIGHAEAAIALSLHFKMVLGEHARSDPD